jgi:hypothetical protein
MFRSSVAAFYLLAIPHFYRRGRLCSRGATPARPLPFGSQVKSIIYRISQVLFAAKIPLCRLDRRMAEQELNLFQLAAAAVA